MSTKKNAKSRSRKSTQVAFEQEDSGSSKRSRSTTHVSTPFKPASNQISNLKKINEKQMQQYAKKAARDTRVKMFDNLTNLLAEEEANVSDEFKAFEQTAEASIQKFDAEATKVNEEKRAKVRRFRACDWRVCLLTCLVHPHL